MSTIKRTAVPALHRLLEQFPCVAVLGARQVGKTTLLRQVLPDAPFYDLERRGDFDRIQRDPDFFLSQQDGPIIIDEAQLLPEIFPALRVAIDSRREKTGQFLLSGSGSPDLAGRINETLAGRIATFELGGLCLQEAWNLAPNPLYDLLQEKMFKKLSSLRPRLTDRQLMESCFLGGYPEPFLKFRKDPKSLALWTDNYLQTYLRRDIRNLFPGLQLPTYQRFLQMLASSSGQILNAAEFARSLDVSQPTVKSYFRIADGTFVWRLLPAYFANTLKRVVKSPKGHWRDSGLLNTMLGNNSTENFHSHPLAGRIWESFITEEILKSFQNHLMTVRPHYYRTHNQTEIDLVLEGRFGLIPIEIKLGSSVTHQKLQALRQFVEEHKLPLGLVINNSSEPAWLAENIFQLPAGCL